MKNQFRGFIFVSFVYLQLLLGNKIHLCTYLDIIRNGICKHNALYINPFTLISDFTSGFEKILSSLRRIGFYQFHFKITVSELLYFSC